jgi:PKD domain
MRTKILSAAILSLFAVNTISATTRKVLFIGNSYTYTNTMPAMLQAFAAAKGDTLIFDQSDPGGYTFAQHSVYGPTITKIFSQQWDIVVLQEQSQLPAFPPAEVDTEVYPYAHKLDSMIHANDTCTQTMFMMTWGHANGDPMNCAFYPVICTYAGMQGRLRESYMQMTQDNHAIVAPVGAAFKVAMDSFPTLWLYNPDSSHPIVPGSYLQTCVLYASIFHKPSFGCSYTDGLTTANAQTLQQIADKVVLDSLSQWQQYGHYPNAGFSYTKSGNTVTFSGLATIAESSIWSFGDGGTEIGFHPVHIYTTAGSYVVTHTATTNCFTERIVDTIHVGATGMNVVTESKYPINILQGGNGKVTFLLSLANAYDMLEVIDTKGVIVKRFKLSGNITDEFVPGFYIYRAFSSDRGISFTGKFFVY